MLGICMLIYVVTDCEGRAFCKWNEFEWLPRHSKYCFYKYVCTCLRNLCSLVYMYIHICISTSPYARESCCPWIYSL